MARNRKQNVKKSKRSLRVVLFLLTKKLIAYVFPRSKKFVNSERWKGKQPFRLLAYSVLSESRGERGLTTDKKACV